MWLKDALEAAKNVRLYRQMGCQEPLIMIPGPDLKMYTDIIEHERKANKLLMNCIEDMSQGKSRCRYCEENRLNECPNPKKKGNVRGCPDWWLMFEEEYENEQAGKAQAAESPEENQKTGVPGDDAGGENSGPDPERDHG